MKKLFSIFAAVVIALISTNAQEAGNEASDTTLLNTLTTLAKEGKAEQIQKLLEKRLESPAYWESALLTQNTKFGYIESIEFIFISDKSLPNLALYRKNGDNFELLGESAALVAKGKGEKQKEGDLTTPIGVYDLPERLTGLDQYYGPLALTTNYPNVFDRSLKKTGSGIWIHGLPLNGNRSELNTRGCIAIDNEILKKYDALIDHKKSVLITHEGGFKEPSKSDLAKILAALFAWKNAWQSGEIEAYLGFYDERDFYRPDGSNFKKFANYKRQVFAKNERKEIALSAISVIPYPNERNRNIFRISFIQDYKAFLGRSLNYATKGQKDIFALLENGEVKFLTER